MSAERRFDIPLTDVRLPEHAIDAVADVLRAGWLSSGPRVQEFERDFADYVGTDHAVACSSGTAALQLAYAVLEIGDGGEVVMPSLTFSACANAARFAGAVPVFADICGDDDLTLDPDAVERAITPRTRAIVLMHYGGHPCNAALVALAQTHGLHLIEDAAHAVGSAGEPGPCGSWGIAGCFSFFANKNLPLGEGGMLVTGDAALAERARRLRANGLSRGTWERRNGATPHYDVQEPGLSLRLDEPRAALGSVLLADLEAGRVRRAALVERYRARLEDVDRVSVPFAGRPAGERSAHHLFVVLLDVDIDRDGLAEQMASEGIETSLHYPPIHLLSAYADPDTTLPRTEGVARRCMTLPVFPGMSDDQVDRVCAALAEAV